jgi:hypothetical protein
MTEVSDIFHSAFTKDAIALKAAVDAAMIERSQQAISAITADVSASMFGATTGEDSSDEETAEDVNQEE